MSGLYPFNQLQFNLGAGPNSMAVKFRSPKPIVVEKLGPVSQSPPCKEGPVAKQKLIPAFHFSMISEESMQLAMRMARKDLQKQKQQMEEGPKPEELPKRTAKKAKGCRYQSANAKPAKHKDKLSGVKVKKSDGNHKRRETPAVQGILHVATRPAAPISPPVRDCGPSGPYAPIKDRGQDSRMMDEIMRLRNEMHTCMSQIQQIEDIVRKGGTPPKPKPLPGTEDLCLAEQARRRAAHSEESAARTARTLYALQQQVRSIQEGLRRADHLTGHRKSSLLTRLAAAHRAAVRALQAFVTQLAEADLAAGLPRAYREFALLVRQLSLCCAQLEVAGEGPVPDSVTRLLKDMADMNDEMEQELWGSSRTSLPASRSRHVYPDEPPALTVHGSPNKENRSTGRASPGRKAVLRCGLEALLAATDSAPPGASPGSTGDSPGSPGSLGLPTVPRLAITPRTPRPLLGGPSARTQRVAWELPAMDGTRSHTGRGHSGHSRHIGHGSRRAQTQAKSYLLPSELQHKHVVRNRPRKTQVRRGRASRPAVTGLSHFAAPTASTRLKKVHPEDLPRPETYPVQPSCHSPPSTHSPTRTWRRVLPPDTPPTFAEPTLASALRASPNQQPEDGDSRAPLFPTSHPPRRYECSSRADSSPRRECDQWRDSSPKGEYLPSVRNPSSPRRKARSILPSVSTPGTAGTYGTAGTASPLNSARRDVARQVLMDRDAAKRMHDINELKRTEKARLGKLRANLDETDEWVRQTEQRIREKLQPLLQDAKEVADRYSELRSGGAGSLWKDLAQAAVNTVECNADVLADMILHDVLEETVVDLHTMEDGDTAEEVAWHMTQSPSIAKLVQRLQDMEAEQDNIRQKWATLVYEDELGPQRASYFDAAGCECPGTPPPIRLTREELEPERQLTPTLTRMMRVPHPHGEDDDTPPGGLYFTRSPPRGTTRSELHLSTRHLGEAVGGTGAASPEVSAASVVVRLRVNAESLENIRGYRSRYDEHLKRTAANPVGSFNPWRVVDELSEIILSDCVESVARELEEINNDVVNQVYQAEFKELPNEPTAT